MPTEKDVLRPKLEAAQRALEAALEEACDADLTEADTSELIRVEESLTVAREAAKVAISVLQRLHRDYQHEREEAEAHRFFIDANGVQWDAFAVYPSSATAGRKALPPRFSTGWLTFQSRNETRRLAPIPETWRQLPPDGLRQLLEKAEVAPRRIRPLEAEINQATPG